MKRYCLAGLSSLFVLQASGQQKEGHLELQVQNHMREQSIGIMVDMESARSCIRVNPGEGYGQARVIADPSNNTLTFLTEKAGAKKVGMVRPLEPGGGKNKQPYDSVAFTGRTMVAGRDTLREGVADNDRHRATYWFSKLVPFSYNEILSMLNAYNGPASGYIYNLRGVDYADGFPVRIRVVPKGKPADSTSVEFNGIRPGKPDAGAFRTEGFELFDVR